MNYSSKLIEDAVNAFSSLPGIGKKSALRLTLQLLKRDVHEVEQFANSFIKMRSQMQYCNTCNNISDTLICEICNNKNRDSSIICVVADFRDVVAIESTNQFKGLYHVLGGLISPMDGIAPSDLNINTLIERSVLAETQEIIMALSATMEGDTTNFFIYKKLKDINVKISAISRGVSVGNELEYTDEITLGRSILQRTPYENSIAK
jgi:recombination protein RecR